MSTDPKESTRRLLLLEKSERYWRLLELRLFSWVRSRTSPWSDFSRWKRFLMQHGFRRGVRIPCDLCWSRRTSAICSYGYCTIPRRTDPSTMIVVTTFSTAFKTFSMRKFGLTFASNEQRRRHFKVRLGSVLVLVVMFWTPYFFVGENVVVAQIVREWLNITLPQPNLT